MLSSNVLCRLQWIINPKKLELALVSPSAKQSATVSSNSNGDLSQFFTFLKDFEEEMRSVTANASGGSIIEDDLSVVMNSVLQTPTKKLWRTAMEQHKLFQQQKIFE